jgi:hypothetical protein
MSKESIIVFSMRRAGSTAFWECFRRGDGFHCFDEPFNPYIGACPKEHKKGVRREFIELFEKDSGAFESMYAPIYRNDELTDRLSSAQLDYFLWLHQCSEGVPVFDVTRCNFKIEELLNNFNYSVFLYLFRSAKNTVMSHLLPSDRLDFWGVRKVLAEKTLYSKESGFNRWGYEELLSGNNLDVCRRKMKDFGIVLNENRPAYIKLMAFWLLNYRLAKSSASPGTRGLSMIFFDEFSQNPRKYLAEFSPALCEFAIKNMDFTGLRLGGREALVEDAVIWEEAANELGFTVDELRYLM